MWSGYKGSLKPDEVDSSNNSDVVHSAVGGPKCPIVTSLANIQKISNQEDRFISHHCNVLMEKKKEKTFGSPGLTSV